MEITVKPEDVDQMVKDALLKAGIGKVVTDTIAKFMGGNYFSSSAVEEALKAYINQVSREVLADSFGAVIKEAVTKHLAEKISPELIQKMTENVSQKMMDAASRNY